MINITKYNANCTAIKIGDYTTFFMSYDTIVAVRNGAVRIKTDYFYSKTTSKHLGLMNVNNYHTLPEEQFRTIVCKLLTIPPTTDEDLQHP